jgi:ABC-2 type transport system permease protein
MISKFIALVKKEWLIISRDRVGLLILFILPACLLLTMSTISKNISNPTGSLKMLILNRDDLFVNKTIIDAINQSKLFSVDVFNSADSRFNFYSEEADEEFVDKIAQAKQLVLKGTYQAAMVIPWFEMGESTSSVEIYTSPKLPPATRDALMLYVDAIFQKIKFTYAKDNLSSQHQQRLEKLSKFIGPEEKYAVTDDLGNPPVPPDTAQYNTTAWAIFGLFFIIVPLASQLLYDRQQSINIRMHLTSTPPILFYLARYLAYIMLNLLQLIVMLLLGVFVLPMIGIVGINLHGSFGLILLVGLFISCAVTSFAIFIGSFCNTQQQVSSIAPFIIVILAAVSGIFVPIFLMPELIKTIAQFSPMYWAQQAFLEVMAQSPNFTIILQFIFKLMGFSIVLLSASMLRLRCRQM